MYSGHLAFLSLFKKKVYEFYDLKKKKKVFRVYEFQALSWRF